MVMEMSITLGDVITGAAFVGAALIGWGALKVTVSHLERNFGEFTYRTEAQFDDVKMELKKIGDVMIMLAENKGQMGRVEDRVTMQGGRVDENTKQISIMRDELFALREKVAAL